MASIKNSVEKGGVYTSILLKVVADAIYTTFFICNHDVGKVTKSLVKDILRQIVPTAYMLGTSNWVFYTVADHFPNNLCFCSRFHIKCRHNYLQKWHCIDIDEKLAEEPPLFGFEHAGIIQPLISNLVISFTDRDSIVIEFELSPIDFGKIDLEAPEDIQTKYPNLHIKRDPQSIPQRSTDQSRVLSSLGNLEDNSPRQNVNDCGAQVSGSSTENSHVSVIQTAKSKNPTTQGSENIIDSPRETLRQPAQIRVRSSLDLLNPREISPGAVFPSSQLCISSVECVENARHNFPVCLNQPSQLCGRLQSHHLNIHLDSSLIRQRLPHIRPNFPKLGNSKFTCQHCFTRLTSLASRGILDFNHFHLIAHEPGSSNELCIYRHLEHYHKRWHHVICGFCNVCPIIGPKTYLGDVVQIPHPIRPANAVISPHRVPQVHLDTITNFNYSHSNQQIQSVVNLPERPSRHHFPYSNASSASIPQLRPGVSLQGFNRSQPPRSPFDLPDYVIGSGERVSIPQTLQGWHSLTGFPSPRIPYTPAPRPERSVSPKPDDHTQRVLFGIVKKRPTRSKWTQNVDSELQDRLSKASIQDRSGVPTREELMYIEGTHIDIPPVVQVSIPEISPHNLSPKGEVTSLGHQAINAEIPPSNLTPIVPFRLEYVLRIPRVKSHKTIYFIPSPSGLFLSTYHDCLTDNIPITEEQIPPKDNETLQFNPKVHIISDLRSNIAFSQSTDTSINTKPIEAIYNNCDCSICTEIKPIVNRCNCKICKKHVRSTAICKS